MPTPSPEKRQTPEPLIHRLHKAIGPLAGGLILDFVDLATFGPLGIGGFFIGALVGWWICSIYTFPKPVRVILAILSGVYCLLPFTELLPVATLISAIGRFWEKSIVPPNKEDEKD